MDDLEVSRVFSSKVALRLSCTFGLIGVCAIAAEVYLGKYPAAVFIAVLTIGLARLAKWARVVGLIVGALLALIAFGFLTPFYFFEAAHIEATKGISAPSIAQIIGHFVLLEVAAFTFLFLLIRFKQYFYRRYI